jgi:hypothetical protein
MLHESEIVQGLDQRIFKKMLRGNPQPDRDGWQIRPIPKI